MTTTKKQEYLHLVVSNYDLGAETFKADLALGAVGKPADRAAKLGVTVMSAAGSAFIRGYLDNYKADEPDERTRIGNTPTTTEDVQKLVDAAGVAQTAYWDALRELEEELAALTGLDINLDDVGDLAGLTVDDVIESFGPNGLGAVDGE